MIITCPQCQTGYNLEDRLLGDRGRTVSCKSCKHKWFQAPRDARPDPPQAEQPASFGEMMEETARETPPPLPVAPEPAPIPEAIRPKAADLKSPPKTVYKPMGIGPGQFGLLTFLTCLFVTAIVFQLARGPLVRSFPTLSVLYESLGIKTFAPGEGLRLSELSAEVKVTRENRVLTVSARLSNMLTEAIPAPALRLKLESAYDVTLKEWTLRGAPEGKILAPGETLPLKFEFPDAPEGGAKVDMTVVTK